MSPKSETRKPKTERNPNSEFRNPPLRQASNPPTGGRVRISVFRADFLGARADWLKGARVSLEGLVEGLPGALLIAEIKATEAEADVILRVTGEGLVQEPLALCPVFEPDYLSGGARRRLALRQDSE